MDPAVETSADQTETKPGAGPPVPAQLGLWDAVSIIVGIVVGSSIYQTPPLIFSNVATPWIGLAAWGLGGILSIIGALVYAELATNDPRQGGDYVYLTNALGRWAGFLFGWGQLTVIRSGSIGMMAFVFADYGVALFGINKQESHGTTALLAVTAVGALAFVNLLGSVSGTWTQNTLSVAKVIGLLAIVIAGLAWGDVDASGLRGLDSPTKAAGSFGLAMVFILYAYGGWNDAAFVAAELRERRNIARSLILGILAITLIYLAVNAAFLIGLGFEGVRNSRAVAADVLALATPLQHYGRQAMCLVVMVSALGAINGMIFTGSRVYASLGAEHPLFAFLGHWHPRLGSPHWALLAQTVFTLLMMLVAAGFESGKAGLNEFVIGMGLKEIDWGRYGGGFDILFAATAPVFWTFFFMTGISYFILRDRDATIERPFTLTAPWYPLLPLIFCNTCLYMWYSAVTYAETLALLGALPLLVGLPLFWLSDRLRPASA